MSSARFALDDGDLAYDLAGAGPQIVLLHGFSLDLRSWEAVFHDLIRDHRVLRYDLRGFGRSSLPRAPYDHCRDLGRILAGLGFDSPLLVGLSLGANIALRYGLESALPPRALALCSSGLIGFPWSGPRPPDQARAIAASHGVEAARDFWLHHDLFRSTCAAGQGDALRQMVAEYSGFHWREADPQREHALPIHHLDQLKLPSLIISGACDLPYYRAIATHLAAAIDGAALQVVADAGHMLCMERPETTARLIREFSAQNPRKAAA